MPNNIQTIIDKFDKEFPCKEFNCDSNGTIANQVSEDEWEPQQCQFCYEVRFPFKQFLKDSLTSMLDEIKRELPKAKSNPLQETAEIDYYYVEGYNIYRQEVINIINSHR